MKVIIQTIVPSPYRVEFFHELGKLCDLTVVYEGRRPNNGRLYNWISKKISYKEIFLEDIYNESKIKWSIIKYFIDSKYDIRLIGCAHTRTGVLLTKCLKLINKPYCLEIDGAMVNREESFFQRMIKMNVLCGASKYFSPSVSTDEYFKYYARIKENKIARYSFTSVSKKDIIENCLTDAEKKTIKRKLGIPYDRIVISVGQFIYRKGYDILLQAWKNVSGNLGLYIIGGKPTNEYNEICNRLHLKNVHFFDFMSKESLADYYKAADLFVLPTREDIWGLVINEAMAYGLPIITTNKCVAGVQLLTNQTHTIVPVNDIEALTSAINYYFKDEEERKKMACQNLAIIKKHSIEDMALEHYNEFKNLL